MLSGSSLKWNNIDGISCEIPGQAHNRRRSLVTGFDLEIVSVGGLARVPPVAGLIASLARRFQVRWFRRCADKHIVNVAEEPTTGSLPLPHVVRAAIRRV